MDKKKLRFYKGYEYFYDMAEKNEVLKKYCEEVFGIDFSQDGFSDIKQIRDLIKAADIKPGYKVLDIGCGNGKMAEYISDQTGATVYGFDYSTNAIKSAKLRTKNKSNLIFEEGIIGEKQYEPEFFDVIISVDTMYFALDLPEFIRQLCGWLKPNGVFITFFGEGPINRIGRDFDHTEIALALRQNKLTYKAVDYTRAHYELMKHKREVVSGMKKSFMKNKMRFYYKCCMNQSINLDMSYGDFENIFNRFMYLVRKS